MDLIDGGYCANNPTLYAIAEALTALRQPRESLRIISIGVGCYPEPKRNRIRRALSQFFLVQLLQKTLNVNTESMETLRGILYSDVPTVRVNDAFERPEMATDLLESDPAKLVMLFQQGAESFAKREADIKRILL